MHIMKAHTLILLIAAITGSSVMALEKPEYEVLYKDGKIEYRQYQPYLVAETEVASKGDRNDAANEGFRRLFNYITGNNTSQSSIAMTAPVQQTQVNEKIAMTAPVQQTPSKDGWRIAFMLPGKFTIENAPVPVDERVNIRAVAGRTVAVIRYSGRWTTRNIEKYEAVLMKHLTANGITPVGSIETAVYNAPFTPPFMRRNEIMLEVMTIPELPATILSEN